RRPHQARLIFREALEADSTLIAARYGLGRVYLEMLDNSKRAADNLEVALRIDSTYVDAHYLMGRAYMAMGKKGEVVEEAQAALRHDPNHALSYLLLAEFYLAQKKIDLAMENFEAFLSHQPEDEGTAFDFAMDLLKLEKYDEVFQIASLMNELNGLPLRAQARMGWGDYADARSEFERYIALLPRQEREVYYDISLVGLPEDVEAFKNTPIEERDVFLRKFWLTRDPFKTSGGERRRAEHYRRVWHALAFYGKFQWPFDRRGAVYVRYGEPDWQSAWNNMNAVVPVKVQRVQERMAFQLYGREAIGMNFIGPVFPVRTERTADRSMSRGTYGTSSQPLTTVNEIDFGLELYKPVTTGMDRSSVGWEVWVYTDIGNGLEVVFTDEFYSGIYDFAPQPVPTGDDIREYNIQQSAMRNMISRLPTLSPGARIDRLAKDLPERYDISNLEPLEFYYEVLTFRGENGQADIQMNFGLPLDYVMEEEDVDTTILIERRITLLDGEALPAQKRRENLGVPVSVHSMGKNQVAVDRVDLAAAPGTYQLALQMSRVHTDRMQAYNQEVEVPDYFSGELMLSDLQLAQEVTEADLASTDKFVRGKWQIQPSPSRAFRVGDPLFVYFEIYSLTRDAFGNTRYEIGYEVRSRGKKRIKTQAKKPSGETVAVRYEQIGTETTVYDYVELNLGDARPGHYTVLMSLKDLNTGKEAVQESKFQILK
ncbi:MAG: GWxTD domain-containing protein, partial [bacterium]|nr:GWxTD domain-containing protein [bacterium]